MEVDTYESLAELSLALIGFAALFGVFGSASRDRSEFQILALRMLVEIAATAFLLSLLPLLLVPIVDASDDFWTICSGVSAVVVGAHLISGVPRTRATRMDKRLALLVWMTPVSASILVVANLLNCAQLLPEVSEWPFRASIIGQLLFSTIAFAILFAMRDTPDEDG